MKSFFIILAVGALLLSGLVAAEPDGKKAAAPEATAAGEKDETANDMAQQEELTVDDLFKRMEKELAEIKTVRANFRQEKELAMFERTVVLNGRIAVQKPGRLAWHVDAPVKYSMVVIGSDVSQWDEDTDRVTKVNIDKDPVFQIAFKQLTLWFSGDYRELAQDYEVAIKQREPLVVKFAPIEGSMFEKMIADVTVTLREDGKYIDTIEIREVTEDKTTIRFKETALNEDIPPELWRVRR